MQMRWLGIVAMAVLTGCAGVSREGISTEQVQKGLFRDDTCTEKPIGDAPIDYCLCKADLQAAVTGDAALDAELRRPLIERMCAGMPARDTGAISNEQMSRYDITRNDEKWLSIVYTHYYYPAGAAHGGVGTEAFIYDRAAKRLVWQGEVLPPDHWQAAATAVQAELVRLNREEYEGMLWVDAFEPEKLFSDNGCYGCVIFPTPKGWVLRFEQYSVGPYVVGTVDVLLDDRFFARP